MWRKRTIDPRPRILNLNAAERGWKKFAVSINYGRFERQNAAAMSSCLRRNENVVLSGGLSYGVEAKRFGARAGMLFAWQGSRSRVVE